MRFHPCRDSGGGRIVSWWMGEVEFAVPMPLHGPTLK
jgi:hypothetical protein